MARRSTFSRAGFLSPEFLPGNVKRVGWHLQAQWVTLKERDPELREPESFMMDSRQARPRLRGDALAQRPRPLAARASLKGSPVGRSSQHLRKAVQTQETRRKVSPNEAMSLPPAVASGKDGCADVGFSRAAFRCPATNFIVSKGNYTTSKSLNPDHSYECGFLRAACGSLLTLLDWGRLLRR